MLRMARVSYLDDLAALDTAEGQAAVRQCRAHLERHGWVHLPGFVAREEVDGMARECLALEEGGAPFLSVESHTPYQEEQDPAFPDDHPRNAMQESSKLIVDYAKVPPDSPLRKRARPRSASGYYGYSRADLLLLATGRQKTAILRVTQHILTEYLFQVRC